MNRFFNYDLDGMAHVRQWNPVVMRCPGCGLDADPCYVPGKAQKHCWHLRACDMGAANPRLPRWMRDIKAGVTDSALNGEVVMDPWRRSSPSVIATQFMGDVAWYTSDQWDDVLEQIDGCGHHVFLMLTKWPERVTVRGLPSNLWIGTSVSDQETADTRIPNLLKTAAQHKWVSVEPMLGPVDIRAYLLSEHDKASMQDQYLERLGGNSRAKVEFVSCGPETGPGSRACSHDLINAVAEDCADMGVCFYDKRNPADIGMGPYGGRFARRQWPDEWINNVWRKDK